MADIESKQKQMIQDHESELNKKLTDIQAKSSIVYDMVVKKSEKSMGVASDTTNSNVTRVNPDVVLETTVPLSETQLSDLLANSPLETKLQNIADFLSNVQSGNFC